MNGWIEDEGARNFVVLVLKQQLERWICQKAMSVGHLQKRKVCIFVYFHLVEIGGHQQYLTFPIRRLLSREA